MIGVKLYELVIRTERIQRNFKAFSYFIINLKSAKLRAMCAKIRAKFSYVPMCHGNLSFDFPENFNISKITMFFFFFKNSRKIGQNRKTIVVPLAL